MSDIFCNINPSLTSIYYVNENNALQDGETYGERIVENYELEYIYGGNGIIVVNGVEHNASGGCVFFRTPNMRVEGKGRYFSIYMILDFGTTDTIYLPLHTITKNPLVAERFYSIYNSYIKDDEITKFAIKTNLSAIVLTLYEENKFLFRYSDIPVHQSHSIRNIVSIIDANPKKHYDISQLAVESGYSIYHFCRKFKSIMGKRPVDYINNTKINLARKMLIETDVPIKEIMNECGFENSGYFFKVFKTKVGLSPTKFKEKHRLKQ